MSGFIEGKSRTQTTLFPKILDEYVAEDPEGGYIIAYRLAE
jgi:hypothetical protein